MPDTDDVRRQYERFPYPPVSALAVPPHGQGERLRWETGRALAAAAGLDAGLPESHDGMRILVAGAGTLEALVVADAHPRAREIVALDLSEASLRTLGRRVALARAGNALRLGPLRGRGLPPVRRVCADLHEWSDGTFDLIQANNVLQHVPDAAALLARLAGWLAPGGLLRVVTYPYMGRFWIRWTRRWLELQGVRADMTEVRAAAQAAADVLPAGHPLRSCWDGHLETGSDAGLVDGFLHALERPLPPLAWRSAISSAGLQLVAEAQSPDARGDLLVELLPQTATIGRWERMQVLDDLLETSSNHVWWLRTRKSGRGRTAVPESLQPATAPSDALASPTAPEDVLRNPDGPWLLPSAIYAELGASARRASALLGRAGVGIYEAVETLQREVGPHVHAVTGAELPGLTLGEHDLAAILATPQPWDDATWGTLAARAGDDAHLTHEGQRVPGATLAEQAAWLHCRHGATQASVPVRLVRGGEAAERSA